MKRQMVKNQSLGITAFDEKIIEIEKLKVDAEFYDLTVKISGIIPHNFTAQMVNGSLLITARIKVFDKTINKYKQTTVFRYFSVPNEVVNSTVRPFQIGADLIRVKLHLRNKGFNPEINSAA